MGRFRLSVELCRVYSDGERPFVFGVRAQSWRYGFSDLGSSRLERLTYLPANVLLF